MIILIEQMPDSWWRWAIRTKGYNSLLRGGCEETYDEAAKQAGKVLRELEDSSLPININ